MSSKSIFSQLFSKKQDSKRAVAVETPHEQREKDEISGTKKLHRSKSGRLKEDKKRRLALAKDTFVAPQDTPTSATELSTTKINTGLTSRELTMHESIRISNTLQFIFNSTTAKDASPTKTKISEQAESVPDFLDDIEVF